MTSKPNRFTLNRMTFKGTTRESGKLEAVINETHGWLDRVTWRVDESTLSDWMATIARCMEEGLDGPELSRNQAELRIAMNAIVSQGNESRE